jgi:Secretion system C-terminal sorting domain
MKKNLYPGTAKMLKAVLLTFSLLALIPRSHAQGLVFKNSVLISGTAGQNNAVYRFPLVTNGVDALVKINARSHSAVRLVSMDLGTTGFDKAFQPQVTYGNNNTSPSGNTDWWMEFQISFVTASTNTAINVPAFSITALDIDGNSDKIREYVGIYSLSTYTLEANTLLQYGSIYEMVNNVSTAVGTQFNGPVSTYDNIDTAATLVMATADFNNVNSFRMRMGAKSTGSSGAADRMYSIWFRSFTYQTPTQLNLPVSLKGFNAKLEQKKPVLSWTASLEDNLSHYVVERSTNGSDYKDVVIVFATGTTQGEARYQFADPSAGSISKGVLYYRLRMVDADGSYKYSQTRILRFGDMNAAIAVQVYPNPAVSEIRVTIPESWQDKNVTYAIFNTGGQVMKTLNRANASQTESVDLSTLPVGSYFIKATSGQESAVQRFIKSR